MKVLAIGAHYDDVELGCGGTIMRLIDSGHEVYYLGFSDIGSKDLKHECLCSVAELGIKNIELLEFPSRFFHTQRQAILELLCERKRQIQPDIIFTHGSFDCHQDHQVIHQESKRAFKGLTMFGYNHIWNVVSQVKHISFSIDTPKKIRALRNYKSQQHREYFDPEYIEAMNYKGEHFEVISLNESILL